MLAFASFAKLTKGLSYWLFSISQKKALRRTNTSVLAAVPRPFAYVL